MFKSVLLVCAQALFVQSIAGQCLGAGLGIGPYAAESSLAAANWASLAASPCAAAGPFAAPWSAAPWSAAPWSAAPWSAAGGPILAGGFGPASASASHGGALPVSSASVIPPNGVSLRSDNAIEGALAVSGALPFLGTVALEGALPTAGAGAVAYSCGNGQIGMLSEDIGAPGYNAFAGPLGYSAGALGYNAPLAAPGYARSGCGCGSRLI